MAHESIVTLTQDNFDSEVNGSEVPVLVDFWAEWCGPCKMAAPVLDQIAEEKGDAVKIGKVDVSVEMDLAAKFGVRHIPYFAFFKGGEKVGELTGAPPDLKGAIEGKLAEIGS